MRLGLLVLLLALAGCDPCAHNGEYRCDGNQVQKCEDFHWQGVVNCGTGCTYECAPIIGITCCRWP